jgi:hypothetical protein
MPSVTKTAKRQSESLVAPYLLAFAFPDGKTLNEQNPLVLTSRIAWTAEGWTHLVTMRDSLEKRKNKIELPICDLRLRLQLEDKEVRRLDFKLGTLGRIDKPKAHPLLFSAAGKERAEKAANDAVLVWVRDVVRKLGDVDQNAAQALQDLATAGKAVQGQEQFARVFEWDEHRNTHSVSTNWDTTQFADLADYVASLLAGKQVFGPKAGPLLREVNGHLTRNYAQLFTTPMTFPSGRGEICFSLGVTLSVETYPGRPLPVVQVHFSKRVWAAKPTTNLFKNLSGYVLPVGEDRALRFDIQPDLTLDKDYQAIAREYDLPRSLSDKQVLTAKELARDGRVAQGPYEKATVFITHRHGQGEKKPAQSGATDQDRTDGFAGIAAVLAEYNFMPWAGVHEVPTKSRQPKDADEAWRLFDSDYKRPEKMPRPGARVKTADELAKQKAKRESGADDWRVRMQKAVQEQYHGPYRMILGFQNGEQKAAEHAQKFLTKLLGSETIKIDLLMLPDGVHGHRYQLEGSELKSAEKRADLRTTHWQEFIQGVEKLKKQIIKETEKAAAKLTEDAPRPVPLLPHGVMILANLEYKNPTATQPNRMDKDDRVNKRAARLAIMRGLELPAQYLLPAGPGVSAESLDWPEFNRRVVNSWRDLAWKSRGYAPGIEAKIASIMPKLPAGTSPVMLGFGVLRANRKGALQNAVSFIPYALELNPATGTARAALLLTRDGRPSNTPLLPLSDAVLQLARNGASCLREGKGTDYTLTQQRQQYTQKFMYDLIDQASRDHKEVVVFFDQQGLRATWDWLNDQNMNPADVNFNKITPHPEPHAQMNWPNVSLLRLRGSHAPKGLRSAPQTKLKGLDGIGERLAQWHCDAQLLRLDDTQHPGLTTYFSFGSDMDTTRTRGGSSYRDMEKFDGTIIKRHVKRWGTPVALEITVIGPTDPTDAPRHSADELATLTEALRYGHAHAPGWTSLPVPLHFASLLRQYVPDYNLPDEREEETAEMEGDEQE